MGRRFEDLDVWQRGIELSQRIYKVTASPAFSKDYGLRDQIRRAAVSVPSNISEGFERESPGDYCRFLLIAKGSCGEVRTQLYIATGLGYLNKEEADSLIADCGKLSSMLSNLVRAIQNRT